MFGIPSIKREGQTMLNMCMEQCEGVYLMNEIERLREALKEIAHFNLYGDYSNAYEIPEIARAALKEGK
jgi:hypothetical protein